MPMLTFSYFVFLSSMRNIFLYLCLSLLILSCKKETPKQTEVVKEETTVTTTEEVYADVPTYDYKGLKPLINKIDDDKVYVVNFWATWCAPCVKELPYFEKINQEYKDKNVEVLLVSLDFPKKKKSHLLPFISKKNIQSEVVHLDDIDEQFWIADIDDSWSGALPATIIYNKNSRKFYEKSFTEQELINELEQFLN